MAFSPYLALSLTALSLPALVAPAPAYPVAAQRGSAARYIATGPTTEVDIARLRAALSAIPGVEKAEMRVRSDGAEVRIHGKTTGMNILAATAKTVGFVLRPWPIRFFAATGPTGEADLARLSAVLEAAPGVDKVDTAQQKTGVALRVSGVVTTAALTAAGKSAGFALRQVNSYVASGPSGEADLARLRSTLRKVPGVEQVEMQPLTGGATLLIFGDVLDSTLEAAAKPVGFTVSPLGNASAPREFRIAGNTTPANPQKLREALQSVPGMGEVEIRDTAEGSTLTVTGGRARPDAIVAAAEKANIALTPLESTFSLPSILPQEGRNTPVLYDEYDIEAEAKQGELAPDFSLLANDGKQKVKLSDYRGKKPVVLIFGSCSCPAFRAQAGPLEPLYQTYKDRVAFLFVYIREAHPGSIVSVPAKSGGNALQIIPQTSTASERIQNLRQVVSLLHLSVPAVIDNETDSVKRAYAAMPIRLYVVGVDGRVAYKGGPGPGGFSVPELEAWLRKNIP